uniref:Turripeptide OL184 n=1 Tax=Iotyrris olangoensis TaxID=2420066 RepID=TU184_IOTOL|nr:RecName: Full=Turripeptide OL184 [Iotyrris olangoensis]
AESCDPYQACVLLSAEGRRVPLCSCAGRDCPNTDSHKIQSMYFCEDVSVVYACPDTDRVAIQIINGVGNIDFKLFCRCHTYEAHRSYFSCAELIG